MKVLHRQESEGKREILWSRQERNPAEQAREKSCGAGKREILWRQERNPVEQASFLMQQISNQIFEEKAQSLQSQR